MPDFPGAKYPAAIPTPNDLGHEQPNSAEIRAVQTLLGVDPLENISEATAKLLFERLDTAEGTSTTHTTSDGTDHANVVTNDTHVAGDGSDHANVATNDTHVAGDGSDHADVAELLLSLADVVITFPDATGGGTTSAGTVQVNDVNGAAVARAVVLRLDVSDTQFAGPGDPAGTAAMDTATTGSILAGAASASLVIKTDATGAFAATLTNAVDEEVHISARTADGGVDALGAGILVRAVVPDSVTYSA